MNERHKLNKRKHEEVAVGDNSAARDILVARTLLQQPSSSGNGRILVLQLSHWTHFSHDGLGL